METKANTALVRAENVDMLANIVPASVDENKARRDRCVEACGKLLVEIEQRGMDAELDAKAALIIERSRKTLRKMNEDRSPVTKLFDQIRANYTAMEKDVDPSNPESVPGKLQLIRNAYAKRLREEAERKRQEEALRLRRENEKIRFAEEVEQEIGRFISGLIESASESLDKLVSELSLDRFDEQLNAARSVPDSLDYGWFYGKVMSMGRQSTILTADEYRTIREQVAERKKQALDLYRFEMEGNKRSAIDMMMSKRQELEKMAAADKEGREKMEKEMKEREQERKRQEDERRSKEKEKEAEEAALRAEQQRVKTLFDQSSASVAPQVSAKVRKRIEFASPDGIIDVLNMWWVNEGRNLSTEELVKKFKSQISFCEKMANGASPVYIQSANVRYVDEVKAR